MKLINVCENIEYLNSRREIRDYLDSLNRHSEFTLDNDYISYNGDLYFHSLDEDVPLKIKECNSFEYSECVLNANSALPIECEELKINNCSIKNQEFTINTMANFYKIYSSSFVNKLIIRNTNNRYCEININNSTLCEFTLISISPSNTIDIRECKNITSFVNIKLPMFVSNFTIDNVGIKDFKYFETIVNNVLSIDSTSFQNYLLTDTVKANFLYIYVNNKINNLLTLLLNNYATKLYIHSSEIASYSNMDNLIKIFGKYTQKPKNIRVNFVMDCAVELIDAGFEEAAEL